MLTKQLPASSLSREHAGYLLSLLSICVLGAGAGWRCAAAPLLVTLGLHVPGQRVTASLFSPSSVPKHCHRKTVRARKELSQHL